MQRCLTVWVGCWGFWGSAGGGGRLSTGHFGSKELLDPLIGQELDHLCIQFVQLDPCTKTQTQPLEANYIFVCFIAEHSNTKALKLSHVATEWQTHPHPPLFHPSCSWTGWWWRTVCWAAVSPSVQEQPLCLRERRRKTDKLMRWDKRRTSFW